MHPTLLSMHSGCGGFVQPYITHKSDQLSAAAAAASKNNYIESHSCRKRAREWARLMRRRNKRYV
jgi:hypothetical protein